MYARNVARNLGRKYRRLAPTNILKVCKKSSRELGKNVRKKSTKVQGKKVYER